MSAHPQTLRRAEPRWVGPLLITLGCATLLTRTVSYESMVATALVGILGVVAVDESSPVSPSRLRWIIVVISGSAVFLAGRALGSGIGVRLTGVGTASIILAAVAEEAFFRRLVYGRLARWGALPAVIGSAVLFAFIHLPTYGTRVLWIDLAAGSVLGWQRWASGGWTAPAATHIFANLLQKG